MKLLEFMWWLAPIAAAGSQQSIAEAPAMDVVKLLWLRPRRYVSWGRNYVSNDGVCVYIHIYIHMYKDIYIYIQNTRIHVYLFVYMYIYSMYRCVYLYVVLNSYT